MSIKYVKDNLLNFTEWNVAIQNCNCRNTMGSGLAKQIREEFPAAYDADCAAAKEGRNTLGNLSMAIVSGNKRIINLYGQADYGTEKRQLDYEAFYVGMEQIKSILERAHSEGRNYKVGIPKNIGCALAGGNWTIVETMIKVLFEDSPIEVYIVEYNKK